MKKKDFEEELDDEIVDDEEVVDDELDDDVIDETDDDGFVDEEEDFEEEIEKAPKKAKKNSGKKLSKKSKIAIISSSVTVGLVLIVVLAIFVILPAVGINLFVKSKGGELADSIDFSQKLVGYQTNPKNVTSKTQILAALEYNESDMAQFFNSSKDKNLIAAQMMFASYINLAKAHQYSYFKNQIGTTNLGSNSGTLIVQRMRRQTKEFKDDTTLKLPYNHDFNAIAVNFVSGEGKDSIRYVKNGHIYRIKSMTIDYDEETGFLYCDDWEAHKDNRWGNPETAADSANVKETRINYLSLVEGMGPDNADSAMDISRPKAIFKKDTAKITDEGDYYKIVVEVDSDVADYDPETMDYFNEDNSASGAHIAKCEITFEIWKCGLPKAYAIDEVWSGKIQMFQGEAQAKSDAKYSYADEDCRDDSITYAIWESVK